MKKVTVKYQPEELILKSAKNDIEWSRLIKERDCQCVNCGSTFNLEAAHIVGRNIKKFRLLLCNGITLCRKCHKKITDSGGGLEEKIMRKCLIRLYGNDELYDYLQDNKYKII